MATAASSQQPAAAAAGPRLTATYTSPTNDAFTLSSPTLPSPSTSTSAPNIPVTTLQKQAHLSALRAAAVQMQDDINTHLTARMTDDNQRNATAAADPSSSTPAAAASGDSKGGSKQRRTTKPLVDEDAEEDNYGEEVVDEDD